MEGKYATEFKFYVPFTAAGSQDYQSNPTLAAADFRVSIDGGAYNELDALPTVSPAGDIQVEIVLSIAEMTGEVTTVKAKDAADDEWESDFWEIRTTGHANAFYPYRDIDLATLIATLQSTANDIDGKTTNLPTDPADQSLIIAGQVAIVSEIDENEAKIDLLQLDSTVIKAKTDGLPTDPADQSLLAVEHATTQALLAAILPAGSRSIVLHTQEADTTIIQQAAVSIWSDSGRTSLVGRLLTDVAGDSESFGLDDGTYYGSAAKGLYTFTNFSFVVSANATVNVIGVSVAPASPSAPDLCVVYGTLLDGSGDPIVGEYVYSEVITPATSSGNQLGHTQVSGITNASGYFEIELIRESTQAISTPIARLSGTYLVPDAASQDITTWSAIS